MIDAVHAHRGQMAPQLWHVGKAAPQNPNTRLPAPLEGPDRMTTADVERTIAAFGEAARQAKHLGFDSLELHGAHGYLIDQFFWDKTNQRTDRFGGKTLQARARFAIEVLQAVRAAVGPDFAVILRLSQWKQQDYTSKLAATPAEMERWLLPLAEAGADIFHLSQRRFWEPEFAGSDLNFAGWAKKVTGRPTITVGSVGLTGDMLGAFNGEGSAPQALDELLRRFDRGDFDLVAVGRAILQDPQWVLKVKEHRQSELQSFTAASFGTYF